MFPLVKIDTQFQCELDNAPDRAREMAKLGFDGAFTFEGPRDVFFPLVAAGHATDLFHYTNVAIAFPRSPMHLAYAAYDLQRLTSGRFALGVGTQIRTHIENRYSASFDQPVARMRELIAATRAIFRSWDEGVRLDFRGDFFTHTLLPPTFDPGPLPSGPPPIWCGAMGPRMTKMVAESADGLVMHPFCTEAFATEVTLSRVNEALQASERSREDFTMVGAAIIAPYRDEAEHDAITGAARFMIGFYGSTPAYRVVLDHHDWGAVQPELRDLTKAGEWDKVGAVFSDEQFEALVISGSPKEVAESLVRRFGGWADRVALSCPGTLPDDLWDELLDEIVSAKKTAGLE